MSRDLNTYSDTTTPDNNMSINREENIEELMFYTNSDVGKNYPGVGRKYPDDSLSYYCKSDDSISSDL